MDALIKAMDGQPGDLLLFAADKNKVVWDSLGALRVEIAKQLDLLDKNEYRFVWITEFPQFEWSDEAGTLPRYASSVHDADGGGPAASGQGGSESSQPAKAYDIVLKRKRDWRREASRIHQNDIQEKMFEALGFTKEQAHSQFWFPSLKHSSTECRPHAGLAYGLDRLVMLMAKQDSIRDCDRISRRSKMHPA